MPTIQPVVMAVVVRLKVSLVSWKLLLLVDMVRWGFLGGVDT